MAYNFSYDSGSVHVRLDLSQYAQRFVEAQQWLGDRVLEDSRSLMPLRTGSLQQRSHTEDNGRRVIFPGPYAGVMYRGKVMVDAETGKGPRKIPVGPGEYILRFRLGAHLVPSGRDMTYSNPGAVPEWFEVAKSRYLPAWIAGVKQRLMGGG